MGGAYGSKNEIAYNATSLTLIYTLITLLVMLVGYIYYVSSGLSYKEVASSPLLLGISLLFGVFVLLTAGMIVRSFTGSISSGFGLARETTIGYGDRQKPESDTLRNHYTNSAGRLRKEIDELERERDARLKEAEKAGMRAKKETERVGQQKEAEIKKLMQKQEAKVIREIEKEVAEARVRAQRELASVRSQKERELKKLADEKDRELARIKHETEKQRIAEIETETGRAIGKNIVLAGNPGLDIDALNNDAKSLKEFVKALRAKYPALPKDRAQRLGLERHIARSVQEANGGFSVSQVLMLLVRIYPEGDATRQKINEELKRWVEEDSFTRVAFVKENVRYYKIL